MRKFYLIALSAFSFCSYSQELSVLRTESNGVVVYKPMDVEKTLGLVKKEFKSNPPRELTDFSVDELTDILYIINLKIKNIEETGDNSDSLDTYVEQRQNIRKRILALKS